jgi:hypothetical protein
MSQITFADREAVDRSLADVRNDGTATNWALFGYTEGSKNQIEVQGTGSGGHSELVASFKPEKIQYGLLRVNDTVGDNVVNTTVKFVFIQWIGEKVKATQRALTATHKGSVAEFIGSHHISIYASNLGECSEQVIMQRVTEASGTAHKVLDEKKEAASSGTGKAVREVGGAGTGNFEVANEEDVKNTINALRRDDGGKTWLILSYQGNTNTVALVGSGSGALSELTAHLKEDGISYGLYRTTVKVDESVTVKFVKVIWVGESIPAVRKAKITTHRGTIDALLGQTHVDVYASKQSEVTEEIVRSKVLNASGVAVHVKEGQPATRSAPTPSPANPTPAKPAATKAAPTASPSGAFRGAVSAPGPAGSKTSAGPAAPKSGGVVSFQDEEAIRAAIAAVRKDGSGSDWMLTGYQPSLTTLELVGSGSGGLAALKAHLKVENVYYGMLRLTEKIDDSVTTKFVFVIFIGEKVPGVKKARVATHKGAVQELFGQYHVDVTASNPGELTDELITVTIKKAAGTLNTVK